MKQRVTTNKLYQISATVFAKGRVIKEEVVLITELEAYVKQIKADADGDMILIETADVA